MLRYSRTLAIVLMSGAVWAADLGRVTKLDLADPAGKSYSLAECREAKAVVLIFLGTECPVSNGYAPELARLAKRYGEAGVRFFGIHADPEVTADIARTHANEYGLPFSILLDPKQKLAGEARATTMPEAVVLKADGQILYRGRIDNRYTAEGKRRDQVTVHNLAAALDAVLAGKAVAHAETKAFGCPLPARR